MQEGYATVLGMVGTLLHFKQAGVGLNWQFHHRIVFSVTCLRSYIEIEDEDRTMHRLHVTLLNTSR